MEVMDSDDVLDARIQSKEMIDSSAWKISFLILISSIMASMIRLQSDKVSSFSQT